VGAKKRDFETLVKGKGKKEDQQGSKEASSDQTDRKVGRNWMQFFE